MSNNEMVRLDWRKCCQATALQYAGLRPSTCNRCRQVLLQCGHKWQLNFSRQLPSRTRFFFFFTPGEIFIISSNDITEMTSCSNFKHDAHTQNKVTSKLLLHNIRMRMRKCINIQMEIDLTCSEEKEETLKATWPGISVVVSNTFRRPRPTRR